MFFLCYAEMAIMAAPFVILLTTHYRDVFDSRSVRLSVGLTVAIVFWTSAFFILRWASIGPSMSALLLLTAACGWTLWLIFTNPGLIGILKGECRRSPPLLQGISVLIVFFLVLAPYLFRNGYDSAGNLHLFDLFASEVTLHLSIVSQLNHSIFPKSLEVVPNDWSSYHYFSNVFINMFSNFPFSVPTHELYVFFFDPLMLIVLAVNAYGLTLVLTGRQPIALFSTFLSLFVYDLSALIFWLRGLLIEKTLAFGSAVPTIFSVWTPIVTQFQIFHNPSYLFSSALLMGTVTLTLFHFSHQSRGILAAAVLCWVFLFKAKISAFLIGFGGLSIFCFVNAIDKKSLRLLLFPTVVAILVAPLALLSVGKGLNSAVFSNWFFPANFAVRTHLIDQLSRDQIGNFGYPSSVSAILRFGAAFLLYYIGLMGFRTLPLVQSLKRMWKTPNSPYLLILSLIVVSFLPFIFLSAKVARHDTMWFYLHTVFFLNILTARFIIEKLESRRIRSRTIAWGHIALIAFGLVSFVYPVVDRGYSQGVIVREAAVKACQIVKAGSDPEERLLSRWYDLVETGDEKNTLLTALSGNPVVSEGIAYATGFRLSDKSYLDKVDAIRREVNRFFERDDPDSRLAFVSKHNVGWILALEKDSMFTGIPKVTHLVLDREGFRLYRVEHQDIAN